MRYLKIPKVLKNLQKNYSEKITNDNEEKQKDKKVLIILD